MVSEKSPESLPPGFTEKIKYKDGRKIKVYIDSSSERKFYSKAAVARYLNSRDHANTTTAQNKLDTVTLPEEVPQTNAVCTPEKIGNVDELLPDKSPKLSITNADPLPEKKKKDSSFKPVACVSSPADGLPPSWTKDMIISKCGSKTRRDPYYTDPNSGYVFRSKPDALRFLKNEDIRYCASRPKRIADLQLIKNEIPSSNPDNGNANENLQTTAQLFPDEERNGGGEISPTKVQANSNDNISDDAKVMHKSCENSNKNVKKENNSREANGAKKVITDSSTEQKLPQSEIEGLTSKTQSGSRKSNKRKEESSLPSRDSKRQGKCEAKTSPGPVLNERAPKAAARDSTSGEVDALPNFPLKSPSSVPLSGPVLNEVAPKAAARNSTGGDLDTFPNLPLNSPASIPPPSNSEPPKVEKPFEELEPVKTIENSLPIEDQVIQEEEQKQTNESCYGFEGTWSDDPCLEFAFKTLTGELSIDDVFRGCHEDQMKPPPPPPQANIANIFQSELVPHSESSKAVNLFPANSSMFSAHENLGFAKFSAFNSQSSGTGAANFGGFSSQNSSAGPMNFSGINSQGSRAWAPGNKGRQTKFNP